MAISPKTKKMIASVGMGICAIYAIAAYYPNIATFPGISQVITYITKPVVLAISGAITAWGIWMLNRHY